MYEICKEVQFAAAHLIRGHPGKCSRLHGHNWRIKLTVSCEDLDQYGIGIDFGDIKEVLHGIIGELDHRNLNDLSPFATLNPTAENIARLVFEEAARRLATGGRRVSKVEVWETPTSVVTYREPAPSQID